MAPLVLISLSTTRLLRVDFPIVTLRSAFFVMSSPSKSHVIFRYDTDEATDAIFICFQEIKSSICGFPRTIITFDTYFLKLVITPKYLIFKCNIPNMPLLHWDRINLSWTAHLFWNEPTATLFLNIHTFFWCKCIHHA